MSWRTVKKYTDGSSLELNIGEAYYYAKPNQHITDWLRLIIDDENATVREAECRILDTMSIHRPIVG